MPTFSFFLACLGGWLTVVEGMLLLGGGMVFEFAIPIPADMTAEAGAAGITLGLGIVGTGFFLNETPGHRKGIGAVTLALGALSLVSGGGFLIGCGLTVAGGLIAMVGRSTPLYHVGHYAQKGPPATAVRRADPASLRTRETAPPKAPPPRR